MYRHNLRALMLGASISVAALCAGAAARAADDAPLVYLSWGAPWGQPGARDQARVTGDTTRVDTLYLSFRPESFAPAFVGLSAGLDFRPQAGDSLGPFWQFGREGANAGALRIDFDVTPYETTSPFKTTGMGFPRYAHTRDGGRLTFVYAVPADVGMPLKNGTVYCIARVLISHRRAHLAGRNQPICIEWRDGDFSMSPETSARSEGGGKTVVSWNAPAGKACQPLPRTAAPPDSAGGGAPPTPARPDSGSSGKP